ncbi:HEAT repeat domain-containing protein [Chloroflexota bacterium]
MKYWLMIVLVVTVALTGVMAACTKTQEKMAPPVAIVKIEVTASTWREGEQPYDVYGAIKGKLERTGFKVVPEESMVYDAVLSVNYTEERFGLYGRQYQNATEWGTRITCYLELVDNTGGELFLKRIKARTPTTAVDLHQDAIFDLMDQAFFRHLGAIIASKFGVGDEVSVLIDTLQDSGSHSDFRVEAIVILGETGDSRVMEPLILALEDTDSSVRMAAVYTLGYMGDERALDPLIQVRLSDEDTWDAALEASAQIKYRLGQ